MSVVVFLVGPAARQLHLFLIAPPLEVPVDKLRAVIAIHSQKPKRQPRLNLIQSLLYRKITLAHQRP
jgi:hypothetical protein